MKRDDLVLLEHEIMKEVVRRRNLGGYSMEAEGILLLSEAMLKVVGHLIDEAPRNDKPAAKK